jgi:hypothetical protein
VRIPCIEVNESVRDGWSKQYSNKNKNGIITFQRKISQIQCQQIDLADDVGLQQRKAFDLMSKEVGGKLTWDLPVLIKRTISEKGGRGVWNMGTLVIYCNTSKKSWWKIQLSIMHIKWMMKIKSPMCFGQMQVCSLIMNVLVM